MWETGYGIAGINIIFLQVDFIYVKFRALDVQTPASGIGQFDFSKYNDMYRRTHGARSNPIYVRANATSRHAVSIRQST